MTEIAHHSHHKTNEKVVELVLTKELGGQRLLDVGAGEGYLVSVLGEALRRQGVEPGTVLSACDVLPEVFKYQPVRCDRLSPSGPLPYSTGRFDIVTCIETIEHVEDQFRLAREFFRVLKPGGRVLVTTPNLLNINSRLRNLHSGFGLLFDILPLGLQDSFRISGHINPVNYYYLAYLFRRAGFRDVRVHFDLRKRAALPWTLLLYVPIRIWHAGFRHHMKVKYPGIYEENRALLDPINSWGMLTSRSLIVEAFR